MKINPRHYFRIAKNSNIFPPLALEADIAPSWLSCRPNYLGGIGATECFTQMLILENFYLGACFFCAMDATDLLWISVTVNVSAALFFLTRALIGRLAARWRDAIEDKSVWRSVVDKHEDEPWRFPRL